MPRRGLDPIRAATQAAAPRRFLRAEDVLYGDEIGALSPFHSLDASPPLGSPLGRDDPWTAHRTVRRPRELTNRQTGHLRRAVEASSSQACSTPVATPDRAVARPQGLLRCSPRRRTDSGRSLPRRSRTDSAAAARRCRMPIAVLLHFSVKLRSRAHVPRHQREWEGVLLLSRGVEV